MSRNDCGDVPVVKAYAAVRKRASATTPARSAYMRIRPIPHCSITDDVPTLFANALFDELDRSGADRSAHAHQSARAGLDRRWPTSWAITTTPSWPTRPACRKERIEEPGLDPQGKGRPAGREPGDRSTTRSSTVGWSRCASEFFGFDDDRDHAGQLGGAVRRGRGADGAARLGRSRCSKQSKLEAVFLTNDFDDPLTGFDTQRLRPLPADRRPGVSSGQAARSASGWRRPPASSVQRRRLAAARRSASCSSISRRTAPGPARFRCRPTSRRRKVDAARGRHGRCRDRAATAPRGRADNAARSGALRLLDAGRVLRRVQAAVRPDDRRQPRRLCRAASTRGRTCTTAASR